MESSFNIDVCGNYSTDLTYSESVYYFLDYISIEKALFICNFLIFLIITKEVMNVS